MYKYELISNHYVVEINGKKYLIDTGCGGTLVGRNEQVIINGRPYGHYGYLPEFKFVESSQFIGVNIDGIIGNDVISYNGLTIYKNGLLDFNILETTGDVLSLNINSGRYSIKGEISPTLEGDFLIDTGAKYGYGNFHKGFIRKNMNEYIHDYNPYIGHFDSYTFVVNYKINGKEYIKPLGDSEDVNYYCLAKFDYHAVINITDLFEEYCVFDIKNKRMIVK